MKPLCWAFPLILALVAGRAIAADEDAPNRQPVKTVADGRIAVGTKGTLPLYVSGDCTDGCATPMCIMTRRRRRRPPPAPPGRRR
jgi:hypothetical protein